MIEQAVGFSQTYAKIVSFSMEAAYTQLSSAFSYIQKDKVSAKFAKSIEAFYQKQKKLEQIFKEILDIQKQKLKVQSERKKQTVPLTEGKNQQQSIENNKQNKAQAPQPILLSAANPSVKSNKFVTFKVSEDDKQSMIKPPTASRNIGCFSGFKDKLTNLVECNYCTQLCSGQSFNHKRQPYQINVTQKQLKQMITKKMASNTNN